MLKLTKNAVRAVEVSRRRLSIQSALGIDDLEHAILVALLGDNAHWPASAMANACNVSRSRLTRRLREREKQGICKQTPQGWTSTEFGREGATMIVNEMAEVVMGSQKYLSPELIEICAAANPSAQPDEARIISFSPLSF